jgi:hypothetical protein
VRAACPASRASPLSFLAKGDDDAGWRGRHGDDNGGDGTAPGTKVELSDCTTSLGEGWLQQPNGSLLNQQSGLCLDDPGGDTANGTTLEIWACNGGANQIFILGE